MRPVFEDDDGRQYVVADDGVRVFGLWYIPRDEGVSPIVVEADQAHRPLANF
ncbi:MAG TPA: hypothetical protein VKE74_12540 [Gemmataceae bacterium]|nr:hypothetical protein [Gemmataceae bacterium]